MTGHEALLDNNPTLRKLINMRNPYIDPINVIQVGWGLGGGDAPVLHMAKPSDTHTVFRGPGNACRLRWNEVRTPSQAPRSPATCSQP